jgi:hypothetical protein
MIPIVVMLAASEDKLPQKISPWNYN